MNLAKLSAAKLQAERDKRYTANMAEVNALIAAGYGDERHNDTMARAKAGDAAAQRYATTWERFAETRDEIERRMAWHGSWKPIKRKD